LLDRTEVAIGKAWHEVRSHGGKVA